MTKKTRLESDVFFDLVVDANRQAGPYPSTSKCNEVWKWLATELMNFDGVGALAANRFILCCGLCGDLSHRFVPCFGNHFHHTDHDSGDNH